MGKKRIASKGGGGVDKGKVARSLSRGGKKKMNSGILHVQSTYNNTKVLLTDTKGDAAFWSSSGSLGFKGAKKGTPYAAGKIGELIAEKAEGAGVKEVQVVLNGVGSGREAAVRPFIAKGIDITLIRDVTPVPFNGPKAKKPRRV